MRGRTRGAGPCARPYELYEPYEGGVRVRVRVRVHSRLFRLFRFRLLPFRFRLLVRSSPPQLQRGSIPLHLPPQYHNQNQGSQDPNPNPNPNPQSRRRRRRTRWAGGASGTVCASASAYSLSYSLSTERHREGKEFCEG